MKLDRNGIKKLVSESLSELIAYHGSGADFNKFDHKHYLSTGAGSQVFGWGTYVTNDPAIANSYAEAATKNQMLPEYDGKEIGISLFAPYFHKLLKGEPMKFISETNQELADLFVNYDYDINDVKRIVDARHKNYIRWIANIEKKGQRVPAQMIINFKKYNAISELLNNQLDMSKWTNAKSDSMVYEVEIPDDNGNNYLEWYKPMKGEFVKQVLEKLKTIKPKYLKMSADKGNKFIEMFLEIITNPQFSGYYDHLIDLVCRERDFEALFDDDINEANELCRYEFMYLYRQMTRWFGTQKAVSLFFMNMGYDGIKYPTGTRMRKPEGAMDDGMNYVIFNANNVKITNKTNIGFRSDNIEL